VDRAREDYVSSIMPGAEVRVYRLRLPRDGQTDGQRRGGGKGRPLGYRVS